MRQILLIVLGVVLIFCEVKCGTLEISYCPAVKVCFMPLIYDVRYRCAVDRMCPKGYKCCRSDCYIHKICVAAENLNGLKVSLPTHQSTDQNTVYPSTASEYRMNSEIVRSTIFTSTDRLSEGSEDFSARNSYQTEASTADSVITDFEEASIYIVQNVENFRDAPVVTQSTDNNLIFNIPSIKISNVDISTSTSTKSGLSIFTEDPNLEISKFSVNNIESTDSKESEVTEFEEIPGAEKKKALQKEINVETSSSRDDQDKVFTFSTFSSELVIVNHTNDNFGTSERSINDNDFSTFSDNDRFLISESIIRNFDDSISNLSPTDSDFVFETHFTIDETNAEHTGATSVITENSSEKFTNTEMEIVESVDERNSSTEYTDTSRTTYGIKDGSQLPDNTITEIIDSESLSSIKESVSTRDTKFGSIEGSGNEFVDSQHDDDEEEMTTYFSIAEMKFKYDLNETSTFNSNLTPIRSDFSTLTVTEYVNGDVDDEEEENDYNSDEVDEDIRNNFQGRLTSG